jgi:hypothetical protein
MGIFIAKSEISIPKTIKSELNFIEKGLVSHNIDGELYFIIKNSDTEASYYDSLTEISLEFDPILRDEFPSVRMIIRFFDKNSEIFNIDHYFSVESEEEVKHLYYFSNSEHINVIFYTINKSTCNKFALNKNDLTIIKKIIEDINT